MGLGPAAVKLNLELWQRGFFRDIHRVVEMGSQELCLTRMDFEELVQAAGAGNYKRESFPCLENFPKRPLCSARPFYEMLGVEKYSCIDLNGEHGAIKHDLNFPLKDPSLTGVFDLVTDHGCNEHAFNIAETYRTMHLLCKKDGLMVIMQSVYRGNGYYNFDLSFFEGLAAANQYKILFASYVIAPAGSNEQYHIPGSRELLNVLDWSKTNIYICYVFQKQMDADFHYPYQGRYLSAIQGHDGYRLQFLPDPPSRSYVPISRRATLETFRAKHLVQELARRAFTKFKLH